MDNRENRGYLNSMADPQPPIQTAAATPRWQTPALCAALVALTLAVFGQTLWHGFVNYDDDVYVYANPLVRGGLSLRGVAWVFTHADCNLYHPLTMLSLMADAQIYGLHAGGYHLTSVLLHTATAVLLFLVLQEMTGAPFRSAFVAAVFAIHPLHVESVAWIAERKDVLSGLFFVLTMGAYVRYARQPQSLARFGWVLLFFALGLLSKPMVITLPVVLLLLDYWPLRRSGSPAQWVLEKVPLFILSFAAAVANYLAPSKPMLEAGAYTLPHRLANAIVNYKLYLDQMFNPSRLAAFYPVQIDQPAGKVALAAALVLAVSIAAWLLRRTQPWILTGWLWYLVMLLPVAGLVQVGAFAHADRYTYLPQIGVYVMLTWVLAEGGLSETVLKALMAGVLIVLTISAHRQAAVWQNSQTLWSHALACTTDNYVAHLNLGKDLLDHGQAADAATQFRATLSIKPHYADAHYDLGDALMQQGKLDAALEQFRQAVFLAPHDANARNNLGNILCRLGQLDEGMVEFQKALQLNPRSAQAHNNFGNALFLKGRFDEAIAEYQQSLQLNPGNEQTRQSLQAALLRKQAAKP